MMIKNYKYYISLNSCVCLMGFLLSVIVLISCDRKDRILKDSIQSQSPSEFTKWVRSSRNNLLKTEKRGDISFECLYKTLDYIIAIEEQSNKIDKSFYDQRLDELSGCEYYELVVRINNNNGDILRYQIESDSDYEKRLKYYSFSMQNDITLEKNGKIYPCVLFHFERTYEVVPYARFLIGFERTKDTERSKTTLQYTDRIFNKGEIRFVYKEEDFFNMPKMTIYE